MSLISSRVEIIRRKEKKTVSLGGSGVFRKGTQEWKWLLHFKCARTASLIYFSHPARLQGNEMTVVGSYLANMQVAVMLE